MQKVIVILGVLLFPKPLSALTCYQCMAMGTGSCSDTQTVCPASQQCGTIASRTNVGGNHADTKAKSCTPSAECDLSGSINLGYARTLMSSKCCSTDLCNRQFPTPPGSSSTPNGKRCYTCNGDDCSNILSCSGDEDRCVSARVEQGGIKVTMKGCVSKSLCVSSEASIPGGTAKASCCEGDLCNSATSRAVSLLLLLAAAVFSVALFN